MQTIHSTTEHLVTALRRADWWRIILLWVLVEGFRALVWRW